MNGRGQNKLHRNVFSVCVCDWNYFHELEFFRMIYDSYQLKFYLLISYFFSLIHLWNSHKSWLLLLMLLLICWRMWGSEKAIDFLSHDKIHLEVAKQNIIYLPLLLSLVFLSFTSYLSACLPCDNEKEGRENA